MSPTPRPEGRDRRRARFGWLAGGLLFLAIPQSTIVLGTDVSQSPAQSQAEALADREVRKPVRADRTRRDAVIGAPIGQLDIPRLEMSIPLVEGVDHRSLLAGAGHVPGTAFPGEPDNVAVAGHRDTHFKKLRHIANGDTIVVETADGTFLYRVDTTFVVTPKRADLLRPTGRPILTLVTCFPFKWIGHAPMRFIVRAVDLGPESQAVETTARPEPTETRAYGYVSPAQRNREPGSVSP